VKNVNQKRNQKKKKKTKKMPKKSKGKRNIEKAKLQISICIWLQKQIPGLMQTNIQITSSKQEEHGAKTYSFYSNNDKIQIRKHHVLQNCHCTHK